MSQVMDEQILAQEEKIEEAVGKEVEQHNKDLKKQAQELQQKLQEGVRFTCSIHGDIDKSTTVIPYEEDGRVIRCFYCNKCLTQLLNKLIDDQKMGDVKIGISKNLLSDLGVTEDDLKQFAAEQAEQEEAEKPKEDN